MRRRKVCLIVEKRLDHLIVFFISKYSHYGFISAGLGLVVRSAINAFLLAFRIGERNLWSDYVLPSVDAAIHRSFYSTTILCTGKLYI
jgi:hypothetical protein